MSVDIKRMLEAIKERRCLYDNRDKAYRDMDLKCKAWEEVAANCVSDYKEDMSQSEKDEKVHTVKTKWRNMSDYYKKEKKEALFLGNQLKPVKYIYSNYINFLDEVLESKRLRKSELYSKGTSSQESRSDYDVELDEEMETYEVPSSSPTLSHRLTPEPEEKIIKDEPRDPLDIVEETTSEDNCDKYFLLSILSHMRNMDENDKIELKIQILQCIKNIINNKT